MPKVRLRHLRLLILNGPNLNLIGKREPARYGRHSFPSYLEKLRRRFPHVRIDYFQSNIEGEIINRLQEAGFGGRSGYDAILLNAGGYTHTSVAIADAVAAIKVPVTEVHITNIYSREVFRRKSLLSPHCRGVVAGFGLDSYRLAIEGMLENYT